MPRKKKCPEGPNNAYLISFGDTMTALLAFFIVLNSLAEEQNGAALHAGTGSFMSNATTFGLPNSIADETSAQPYQMEAISPKYIVPDPDGNDAKGNNRGPDEEDDQQRIIDRQKEDFHRFLQEVRRINKIAPAPGVAGEVSFDVLEKLPREAPYMTKELKAALNGISPMLRRSDYVAELTVWCTTPSKSAWTRAIKQADELHRESAEYLRLSPDQQLRLTATAQPWISKDVKRPTVSVTVKRLKAPGVLR
jgi:hypothetical protein